MSQVDLSFACQSDRDDILSFIQLHWRSDHVFVTAPEVLDWQHQASEIDPGDLSFVLARESETGALIGLLGYISYLRFDPEIINPPIALALWKTIESTVAGLGVRMLWFLEKELSPSVISVIGLNETVEQLYDALGYKVGAMDQWVLFKAQSSDALRLAQSVPEGALAPLTSESVCTAVLCDRETLDPETLSALLARNAQTHIPEKRVAYVTSRFFEHPFYEYKYLCIYEGSILVALLVGRAVEHEGVQAFRAVDFFGPTLALKRAAAAVQELLGAQDFEYLELMFLCDFAQHLCEAGFVLAADHPEMIVPAFFEPFVPRTVSIAYAYKCQPSVDPAMIRLCRADSDQDRPNVKPDKRPE